MGVLLKITLCLAIIQTALADLETPNGVFKTNCFTDTNNGECEHSRIKICHAFYACDLVVEFPSPIKRIGIIDDDILVAEGQNTHLIDERKMSSKKVKIPIPPVNEFVDKKGNRYYSGEGTTYLSHKESGKEIEIVTTGEYSFNQMAIDVDENILFILTFSSRNNEKREGKLFGVELEPLKIVDDKIHADLVGGDQNITAVAGGFHRLLLGIRTEHGNKLVRLAIQEEDPCEVLKSPQTAIKNIIKTTEDRLLEVFEENLISLNTRSSTTEKLRDDLKFVEEQYSGCQVQLEESRSSTEQFRQRISSFTESMARYNALLLQTATDQQSKNNDLEHPHDDSNKVKECLFAVDVKFMRNRIKELEDKEKELVEKLRTYSTELNEIMGVRTGLRFSEPDDDAITFTT